MRHTLPLPLIVLVLLVQLLRGSPADAQQPERSATLRAGIGVGALLLASLLADSEIREEVYLEANGRYLGGARVASALAEPKVMLPGLALAYGAGRLAGRPGLAEGAERSAVALAAATHAAGAVKITVGRLRPDAGADRDELHPGALAGRWQSFPSGHTAAAFALATSIAEESHDPTVSALAYAGAAAVGWSRVYRDAHWSSDVVAGALVGIAAGRWAGHWSRTHHAQPTLQAGPDGVGVGLSLPMGAPVR
jgi:membrane-associated phospholipid phosphatase